MSLTLDFNLHLKKNTLTLTLTFEWLVMGLFFLCIQSKLGRVVVSDTKWSIKYIHNCFWTVFLVYINKIEMLWLGVRVPVLFNLPSPMFPGNPKD